MAHSSSPQCQPCAIVFTNKCKKQTFEAIFYKSVFCCSGKEPFNTFYCKKNKVFKSTGTNTTNVYWSTRWVFSIFIELITVCLPILPIFLCPCCVCTCARVSVCVRVRACLCMCEWVCVRVWLHLSSCTSTF